MTPSILQQIGVSVLDYLFYESKYGLDSLKVLALCQIHKGMHATLCIRSVHNNKDEALECNSASSMKSPLGFASMQKKRKEKKRKLYCTLRGLNPGTLIDNFSDVVLEKEGQSC